MKVRTLMIAAASVAALGLSGCGPVKKMFGGGKPSGQVVATVDGEEITSLELRTELGNFGSRDPKVMKAAQQQALQRIIIRKLLAKEAEKQKLDKSSEYTVQVERGKETLLGQLLERKYASAATPPARADAEAFVASHPDMFANRKVMFVEQVIAGPNKIPQEQLRPLKTLDEVKSVLSANNVQYQENAVVLDTLSANPKLVEGIKNLPPDEIFVIPQNGSLLFNQVAATRPAPFQGDVATGYAMNVLRSQRARELVAQRVSDMRKAAESKIKYNPAYKPPAPPAKGATPPAKK